LIVGLNL
jgi:hypothetical protein